MTSRARLFAALALALGACARRSAAPSSFRCDELQERAERCEAVAMAVVRGSIPGQASDGAGAEQFRMFELRFKEKLRGKKVQAQCGRFRSDPAQAGRLADLEACTRAPDCEGFVRCLFDK